MYVGSLKMLKSKYFGWRWFSFANFIGLKNKGIEFPVSPVLIQTHPKYKYFGSYRFATFKMRKAFWGSGLSFIKVNEITIQRLVRFIPSMPFFISSRETLQGNVLLLWTPTIKRFFCRNCTPWSYVRSNLLCCITPEMMLLEYWDLPP